MMKPHLWKAALSAVCLTAGLLVPAAGGQPVARLILLVAAYLIVGLEILIKAVKSIGQGQVFNEFFLMTVATLGAMALGEYAEATAVMLFYQIGEYFQSYAVGKSRRAIQALMDLMPETANLERDGAVLSVEPDQVEPGDVIVIRPGERVPLDGVVLEGLSQLDQSALTGEPVPVPMRPGSEIISGCVNLNGVLRVRVLKPLETSSVSRILELIEDAAARKSRSERFITRFSAVYTPAVVLSALLLCLIPVLLMGQPFVVWLHRALTFLVVSCPCALVISVPLSFFGGIGACSKSGILVKGSHDLEMLSRTDAVVFDKTGTLTAGTFEVQAVVPVEGADAETVLQLAAAAESQSNHPIAASLIGAAGSSVRRGVTDIREQPGCGVQAVVDGHIVLAGRRSWLVQSGVHVEEPSAADSDVQSDIGTQVWVAADGRCIGRIRIADAVKPDAARAIGSLKQIGIRQLTMLTGDNRQAAEAVAGILGIEQVYSGLMPQDKVALMDQFMAARQTTAERRSGGSIVFVGDGVNDAPVLALADVGVAMGGLGQDAAIEAADVVLLNDQPSQLVQAIRLARRTVGIARQNIIFALSVKGLVLVLSALGMASMWVAVFADVGVSILAILNAMRCLVRRDKAGAP